MLFKYLLAGGETIREICRQSGAHVELNRDQTTNISERVFRIQGSPDQIRQAVLLVNEKAGVVRASFNFFLTVRRGVGMGTGGGGGFL